MHSGPLCIPGNNKGTKGHNSMPKNVHKSSFFSQVSFIIFQFSGLFFLFLFFATTGSLLPPPVPATPGAITHGDCDNYPLDPFPRMFT